MNEDRFSSILYWMTEPHFKEIIFVFLLSNFHPIYIYIYIYIYLYIYIFIYLYIYIGKGKGKNVDVYLYQYTSTFFPWYMPGIGSRCPQSLSHVQLFATPWTVARLAPLSRGFSRQEYWSGFPCPPPGHLPNQELNPGLLHCRQNLYRPSHQGSPKPLPVPKIRGYSSPIVCPLYLCNSASTNPTRRQLNTVPIYQKKSTCQWTCVVQTHIAQGGLANQKGNLEFGHSVRAGLGNLSLLDQSVCDFPEIIQVARKYSLCFLSIYHYSKCFPFPTPRKNRIFVHF